MSPFEFSTAQRIVFGPGTVSQIPAIVSDWGRQGVVVTGRHPGVEEILEHCGEFDFIRLIPNGEPDTDWVAEATREARKCGANFVIGIGGGSVIDAAKAIAGCLTNPGELLDYLEVVGRGQPMPNPAAPWMAVPTTSGTGAEATRNAVLLEPREKMKVSLRSPHLLARVALVDPELTRSLPASITASTGMDAVTQLIESYLSCRANPLTDSLCREGILRAAPAIRRAWAHPDDLEARSDMSLASLLSGMALANAGLGAVHGFAAPIGGRFSAPHGAVCAALLPHVLRANLESARKITNENLVARFRRVAIWLTDSKTAHEEEIIVWAEERCREFSIPSLGRYGIQPEDVPEVAALAAQASSMKGNPVKLTNAELEEILRRAS